MASSLPQIMTNKGMIQMKSDSRTFLKKDHLGHVRMIRLRSWLMSMTLSLRVVLRWSKTSNRWSRKSSPSSMSISSLQRIRSSSWEEQSSLKNGNITMDFSQQFIGELRKIFEVTGKVTTTGLKLQALSQDHKFSVTKSFIRSSGRLDGSAQRRPQVSRQRAFEIAHQSSRWRYQKSHSLAQVCQSDQRLRLCHGASTSNQESRWQVSFWFRLSAIQIQIGQVVKSQGHQQVAHCSQSSMSFFSPPAKLRLQLLTRQQSMNFTQWLRQQWNH